MRSPSSLTTVKDEGTRVILIRHGRSTFNQLKLYQGSSDASVLTEQGYDTARQVGKFLKDEAIDTIHTSPLKRVQQTIDVLLEELSICPKRIEIHPSLREIDMSGWEGRSFQDVQQTEPDAYQCWKQRPHEFRLSSCAIDAAGAVAAALQTYSHPVLDLYDRAQQFWREILPRHCGQTIAIVCHGGTNRALISTAIGLAPARFHSLQQSNCGVSVLNFSGSCFTGQLKTLNLTTPLGETLPKLKEGKQGLRLLLFPAESSTSSATHLSELLSDVAIDFSLTNASDIVQNLTAQMLQRHRRTVQIQSDKERFLLHWQRTLAAKSNDSPELITGLVVAQSAEIQQNLGEAIGLNSTHYWQLQVQPGTLSVLHYPIANHSPVIQALNFA